MQKFLYHILGIILRALVRFVGRIIYRIQVREIGHIPATGGALVVANHTSYMDFVLIISSLPRPVSFVMNADVYNKPSLKWIFKGMHFIPIAPREGKNDFESFNKAVTEQIDAGRIVVIFAEGTVSRTGQILEFKKGVEHLASRISAPVIPIHFHNVQGTPFTFRAGKKKMERLSLGNIRKEVLVAIGAPMNGGITAFGLRQKIKELEVSNFDLHLSRMKSLDLILKDQIGHLNEGQWNINDQTLKYSELHARLQAMDGVLKDLMKDEMSVALLLPKSIDSMVVQLWMLTHKKVIVPIDSSFTSEEQFYVMNRSGARTILTTRDIAFTRYAPTADRIVYIEDVIQSMDTGLPVHVICKHILSVQRGVKSLFAPATKLDEPVVILFERETKEEMRCVSLTHRNLLAVIHGLRQIYYFEKGSHWMSNLPLHNSVGFVLELLMPVLHDISLRVVSQNVAEEEFMGELEHYKPSVVIATPSQLELIAGLSQKRNIPFLTHVFTADLYPENHQVDTLTQRGIDVLVCAGMNETSSVFAVNLHNYRGKDIAGKWMEQENRNEDSIGKPLPGVALRICDAGGKEMLVGEEGTIWISGSAIAPTLNDEIQCHAKLVDGWFNTGLSGSLDQKGFIRISE